MSAEPEERCRKLRVQMAHAREVVPSSAKHVETEALRVLGNRQEDGEWSLATLANAMSAVEEAFASVGRRMHVDPGLTWDQARRARVALAIVAQDA
jgi:hypothetical protein